MSIMPQLFIFIIGTIVVITIGLAVVFDRKKNSSSKGMSNLTSDAIKYSLILNYIDDGVMLIGEDDTIQLFNPSASRISGWDASEAVGLDYKVVIKLQDSQGEPYNDDSSPFNKSLTSKTSIRDEDASLATKYNTVISVDVGVTPLFNEVDEFQGYIVIFRDVTKRRLAEQERADFISTASHEMRTPVAAIEGFLALALNEKVSTIDSKARGFLTRAHENSKHLGKLFQDLLASSQADDGRLENNPTITEVGELVTELVNNLRVLAEAKNLSVEFVMGDSSQAIREGRSINMIKPLYYANIDPDRIKEALTNLFDNAVKYTASGKITVGLTGDESIIQIRIQDTGMGIAPENINHLFQKFYRVDSSDTRTIGGTGLGLFICKKIIELYSGRIWAESKVGEGSTFFINLPRVSSVQASSLDPGNTDSSSLS